MDTFVKLFIVSFLLTACFYCSQTFIGDILRLIGGVYILTIVPWRLAKLLKSVLRKTYVSPKSRAVLITGCDSGFGLESARQLDRYGFTVFAGCLDPNSESVKKLREECSQRLLALKLDITSEEDVDNVVKTIESSNSSLWALVNNAGILSGTFVEEGKGIEIFEKVFRVNVFGTIRLTKRCLPLIREAKGRVVNVSSILARFPAKGHLHYSMSKSALRRFNDGLRRDMEPFGVKVVSIEPAGYKTKIADLNGFIKDVEENWSKTDREVKSTYGEEFKEKIIWHSKAFEKTFRNNIHEVIDAIEEAVTVDDPEVSYTCGGTAERIAFWVFQFMPDTVLDFIFSDKVLNPVTTLAVGKPKKSKSS